MSRSDNNDATSMVDQKSDQVTPGTHAAKDSIGMLIRMLRQQSGLTQENLADALGVGRSLVARWETDRGGEAFLLHVLQRFWASYLRCFSIGWHRKMPSNL
jgi:DNA-binding transcriptional regulator YiaG